MTVVSLWKPSWTPVQSTILRWLASEPFPKDTHFVWTATIDSESQSELEKGWVEFECTSNGYTCDLLLVPQFETSTPAAKHHVVATLYEEAIDNVQSEFTMFVEDDVVAAPGAVKKLLDAFKELPKKTAGLMAIYRSRRRPSAVCASGMDGQYLPWPPSDRNEVVEVAWMGGGLTLYRSASLHRCRPFHSRGSIGWDSHLC